VNLYDSQYCSGNILNTLVDFGCGGQCFPLPYAGMSVYLDQDKGGNPKPTIDVFSDSNCQTKVGHDGISGNQNGGCTNSDTPFLSYYAYFDC